MTPNPDNKQGTFAALSAWIDGFLISRQASGKAAGTMRWYKKRLTHFAQYCAGRDITSIESVDARLLREYLISLAEQHNPGGTHGYFRAIKALFLWYEREAEPAAWRNPIRKVAAPKVPEEILRPVSLADVGALVRACGPNREGARDRAILITLLDTGARAEELTGFELADLNPVTGELVIRKGKGGKGRTVFLGHGARQAVRQWIRKRGLQAGPLFCAKGGGRLTYSGLRSIMARRSKDAGIKRPSLHSFRRACALAMLRSGADVVSIQRILGHANLAVLRRYLRQSSDDLREVHARHSPGDKL